MQPKSYVVVIVNISLQTVKRLNREGLTMTRETYRGIMDDIGSDLTGSCTYAH